MPQPDDIMDWREDFSALRRDWLAEESGLLGRCLPDARVSPEQDARIQALTVSLLEEARAADHPLFENFLQTWRLDSREGRVLLTLAEALLRIPDDATRDALIHDVLPQADWRAAHPESHGRLTDWAARALSMAGAWLGDDTAEGVWRNLHNRLGDRMIRPALTAGIQWMANRFVLGETPEAALQRTESGLRYSFDCLGEAAQTPDEAEAYFQRYLEALETLARHTASDLVSDARNSLSVKLSALHPRYGVRHATDIRSAILSRLTRLVIRAADAGIPVTLDAEESEHLEMSLALFAEVRRLPALRGYDGFGLAVQAYQKRAGAVIDWLTVLSETTGSRIPVRLVKGAYWDTEIRQAQLLGLEDYPVFTRKRHTDLHYLACARRLLDRPDCFLPQFATHNARTLAWLEVIAQDLGTTFEVQRLTGMGDAVHHAYARQCGRPLRLYAPVGRFSALLPYLVRRLLENGSAQSFVNRLADPRITLAQLAEDPVARIERAGISPHPRIPAPVGLYPDRANSPGLNLANQAVWRDIQQQLQAMGRRLWSAGCGGVIPAAEQVMAQPRHAPGDKRLLGAVRPDSPEAVHAAYRSAAEAFPDWSRRTAKTRADTLRRAADLLIVHQTELLYLLIHEGGKTLPDARDEWREAVDLCRYYANNAESLFAPRALPAVAGDSNRLSWHPRGVFLCISPWNFPLAILLGQAAAALVCGNTVLIKPASQTPLIAQRVHALLLEAGIPAAAVHCLAGSGRELGDSLLEDANLAGVVFTGSTATARHLAQTLAARPGPLLPLIAETGGLNAMIADSSALPEQLVRDAMTSAFNSAGQRCSALRVLWLQEELLPAVLPRLSGAMACWRTGRPDRPDTDSGPVIDQNAREGLLRWMEHIDRKASWRCHAPPPLNAASGLYVPPAAFLLAADDLPTEEIFGPILHIATWKHGELDRVLDRVHASGYGLTLGVHSRITANLKWIAREARVGNLYLNRNQIGAVVENQPFGGEGLSGTGFKAGGPHYLMRFCTERCVTDHLAALGLNPHLLDLCDEEGDPA